MIWRVFALLAALLPATAVAQQSTLPGFPPGTFQSRPPLDPAPGGGVFASYTQTDNPPAQPTPGSTTVTFSSVNIGTAASNRVVVLVFSSTSVVASTATVGGISLTKQVEESSIASGLQIWSGTVPTGTTANAVFTFASNPTDCVVIVGSFNSGASTTPVTQTATNASATSQSLNITIPSGGFAVMGTYNQQPTQTPTWTNMTASGGDAIRTTTTGDTLYTAHSTTAGSPTALSVSLTGSASQIHSVSASWGP